MALPRTKNELGRLELLNLTTGGKYSLGLRAAVAFQSHEFLPNDIAQWAVENLNAAMALVRLGDPLYSDTESVGCGIRGVNFR